jgi:hypothetical protein
MPGVALSSLRVAVDADSSGYSRAMADKVAADTKAVASSGSVGAALAPVDAQQDKLTPPTAAPFVNPLSGSRLAVLRT